MLRSICVYPGPEKGFAEIPLGARCAAEAPEQFSIYPGRTCGFAAKILDLAGTTRMFAEQLIDCEEERVLRAVVFGLLAKMERKERPNPEGRFEWPPPQASPAAWPR